jgi:hypothetical protein
MEKSWKEKELRVFEPEAFFSFGDSTFAKDQARFSPQHRFTYQRPFFEANRGQQARNWTHVV